MTTTSQRHPLSTRTKRLRTSGLRSRAHRRSHGASEERTATPVMGPANHAPGMPIMGIPGRSQLAVMGGPDAAAHISVMGAGDQGTRTDLFGDSDPRFVDSLFTARGR